MKSLFDTTTIKGMQLKNRFIRSATWRGLADSTGHITPELSAIYEALAKGGVGTIITGYAFIDEQEKPNPGMISACSDAMIPDFKSLTTLVHQHDTNIVLQLAYGGSMTDLRPFSPRIFGPSAIENELTHITPIEMTKADIDTLIDLFSQAARRAKEGGFDAVEIHAAHGYLLSQFLSPFCNKRTDAYGGCISNRTRIIIEVIQAMRKVVGPDFPIWVKINAEDFSDPGLTSTESIVAALLLEEAGVDLIDVSGGNACSKAVLKKGLGPSRPNVKKSIDNESYFKDTAAVLATLTHVPIILTGGNRHLSKMTDILNTSDIDYFALSRPLIREPDLIQKFAQKQSEEPLCISCNKCFTTPGKHCIFNHPKK